MKKYFIIVIAAVAMISAGQQNSPITKENGTDVVNTTTLAKDVEGYNGAVPVKIYIKKKIVIVILGHAILPINKNIS